jgi:hypothetical protein
LEKRTENLEGFGTWGGEGEYEEEGRTGKEHCHHLFSSSTYSGPKHVIEVGMNLESDYLKTNATEMIF